jgi:hypothetical protein
LETALNLCKNPAEEKRGRAEAACRLFVGAHISFLFFNLFQTKQVKYDTSYGMWSY